MDSSSDSDITIMDIDMGYATQDYDSDDLFEGNAYQVLTNFKNKHFPACCLFTDHKHYFLTTVWVEFQVRMAYTNLVDSFSEAGINYF